MPTFSEVTHQELVAQLALCASAGGLCHPCLPWVMITGLTFVSLPHGSEGQQPLCGHKAPLGVASQVDRAGATWSVTDRGAEVGGVQDCTVVRVKV